MDLDNISCEKTGLLIRVIYCPGGEKKLPNVDEGYYYDLVEIENKNSCLQPLLMCGPFDTKELALEDADLFIEDAMTDYTKELE